MNSENEIKIRKCESILRISGAGVVALGAWNVIRSVIFMTTDPNYFKNLNVDMSNSIIRVSVYIILAITILIDILLRLYIARHARYEAKSEKGGNIYIVFIAAILLSSLYSFITHFNELSSALIHFSETIIGIDDFSYILVDISDMCITLDMLVAAVLLRVYRKRQNGSI